jgi:hypothetical protein
LTYQVSGNSSIAAFGGAMGGIILELLRNFTSKWLHVAEASTDRTTVFWHIFWTIVVYAPFMVVFFMCATLWLEGRFNEGHIVLITIFLYISLFLQAKLNFGIFKKFDYIVKVATLPIAILATVLFKLYGFIENSLTTFFEILFRFIGVIIVLFLIVFVFLGLFGILLFGLRQIF